MKHLKKGRKFHRKRDQRKALLKSLAANLIIHEKIKTTLEKAKETKITVEKLITIAKKQDLVSLRNLKKKLPEKAANKLYYELAPLFANRKGGYTRIIKTSERRVRDAVSLVILEFVDKPVMEETETKQTELEKQQK
ncbi:MAG: 50S ribosomal protein L17 [Candidatus Pacebacteria bacterium]|jgi:large subunit ribosomal protein L17|nr:50S ribosomal protein L17 [Candidatus Paceibacterota bacterium]MDD5721699.1 50S ribosomal protein L17 [Candidatus Paceibacterota bacterium]